MQRILIIRFSSIGDIVLTTPVIRVLRTKFPEADIRFVTKEQYVELVSPNLFLNGVFLLKNGLKELASELRCFNPDLVVDLHHNLRTRILKTLVGGKWLSFHKLNVEKWLKVNLKVNRLPDMHVVDRYVETLQPLGISNDGQGLEFHFPENFEPPVIPDGYENGYVALVVGAKFKTKQLPESKLIEICQKLDYPIVLIGGPEDKELGKTICEETNRKIWNACGEFNLLQSACLIKESKAVITHDTGMMHIAAAFNKKVISIWGNTIPAFGMYPYMPQNQSNYFISEVPDLSCRPCSKIGFDRCPKGHFDCMEQQDVRQILGQVKNYLQE